MGDLPQPALIDETISTFMMLKGTFSLTLRATKRQLDPLFKLMNVRLCTPDYSCVSIQLWTKAMAVRPNYVRAAQCILLRQISTMVFDGIVQIDRDDYQSGVDVQHRIKRTAIPASGYIYQTLVGIRLLCDWLSNPALYDWVQFEADDQEDAKGLDDIVAQRPDGLLELVQVKFTVDPFEPKNALSWSWLLQRKGTKGKSLLEKWSAAAFRIGLDRLGKVSLTTNRRPDASFSSQLYGTKVDLTVLPEALRDEVAEHVGGASNATLFFDRFEFSHSYEGYETLDRHVSAELERRHTDHQGWLALYRQAIDWSIRRNSPSPDGLITLEVLRATISERQPRPLDQNFRIPTGYLPPDPEFADAFVEEVASGSWNIRILWGSPGQGKSTFLSYLCSRMTEYGLPFVRHHYFLDLQDPSDRFSLKSVAHSLIAQMQAADPVVLPPVGSQPEDLRTWLTAYGDAYAAIGKRFVVIIDGLDHVWRENAEIIEPLESLFAQLLPLPANTSLILGTQRVEPAQLPARLNRYTEQEHWVELPRMRLSSIRAWLDAQFVASTFRLESVSVTQQPDQLAELSLAFEHITEGHPLVLTYTYLALIQLSPVLTARRIYEHTPHPLGDARAYYRALWQGLSWQAKDALHLMAEDGFIWPMGALGVCLGTANSKLEDEVGHLLVAVDAGLIAFHGSLYVFVSSQADHHARLQSLLPNVRCWLTDEAPAYLRWAWLWLYESRLGEYTALLAGTTRTWAIAALTRAYPVGQISRILAAAEEVAFISGDYEQAIRKRWLKIRLDSGLTHQLDDPSILEDYALRLTPDPYPALLLASEVSQNSIAGLHQFATLCLSLGQAERGTEVQERMRHKINDRLRSGVMASHERDQLVELYLEVAAGTGHYEPAKVLALIRQHNRSVKVFENFLRDASLASELNPIMAFVRQPMPVSLRRLVEVEAVRTGAWIDAKLHEWDDFNRFTKHPLSSCWRILYKHNSVIDKIPSTQPHEALVQKFVSYDETEFARYLHFMFFASVGNVLLLRGAQQPGGLGVSSERTWLNAALDKLAGAANKCGSLFARGEYPDFSLIYRLVDLKRPALSDHEAWADLRSLTKALSMITADLFFLGKPRSRLDYIPSGEWKRSYQSELFALHDWRKLFLTRHFRLLSENVVRAQIETQAQAVLSTVGPFNEKGSELTELCGWATAYGMSELGEHLLANAYRYGLAYGWRKDWRLPSILDAVAEASLYDSQTAISLLEKLAPIYSEIGEMTEKSGANTSDLAGLLLKLMPEAYLRFYRFLLDRGEWYEAEQVFAAFIETIDESMPATAVVTAFLWDEESRKRVKKGANLQLDVMLSTWEQGRSELQNESRENLSSKEEALDESLMPAIESYPPSMLPDFAAAVRDMKRYSQSEIWFIRWFEHWCDRGKGVELLDALGIALGSPELGAESALLDRAFHLCLKLHGPNKAFRWIVEAHRHRRGWSEQYHGAKDSTRRIALVAQHYPKRWAEFVAQTSRSVSKHYEPECVIPDVGLMSLLLRVGEVQRAMSVLQTIVDLVVEEFEVQPLTRPEWLDEERA